MECDVVHPENGNATVSGTGVGAMVEYTCDDGYILVGTSVQVCLDNGTWSDPNTATCDCK